MYTYARAYVHKHVRTCASVRAAIKAAPWCTRNRRSLVCAPRTTAGRVKRARAHGVIRRQRDDQDDDNDAARADGKLFRDGGVFAAADRPEKTLGRTRRCLPRFFIQREINNCNVILRVRLAFFGPRELCIRTGLIERSACPPPFAAQSTKLAD